MNHGLLDRSTSDRRLALAVALIALALLGPTAAEASPSRAERNAGADPSPTGAKEGDLLPDMRLEPLYEVTIQHTNSGRKRLRFGTRAFNIGAGPLEVRGRSPVDGVMSELVQWIANEDGGGREVTPRGGAMYWAGDGHRHWHVEHFMVVELLEAGGETAGRLRKIGFCLIDLLRHSDPPPHAPPERGYPLDACGTSRTAESIRMGISVGYADDYQPTIAHQWLDITGLPKGVYRLCAKVNPLNHWRESRRGNNFFWHELWLNPARSIVRIRASGRSACGSYAPA